MSSKTIKKIPMKKRKYIIIAALLLLLAGTAHAQVFMTNDDDNLRVEEGDMDVFGRIPYHGVDYDQANDYAPVGEGILLLSTLGGAYLLGKRKKQNK